jgi:hypothetical protein
MITIRLSDADAAFLRDQLVSQAQHVETELVHTDARDLQRSLAHDLEHLRALLEQLERSALD